MLAEVVRVDRAPARIGEGGGERRTNCGDARPRGRASGSRSRGQTCARAPRRRPPRPSRASSGPSSGTSNRRASPRKPRSPGRTWVSEHRDRPDAEPDDDERRARAAAPERRRRRRARRAAARWTRGSASGSSSSASGSGRPRGSRRERQRRRRRSPRWRARSGARLARRTSAVADARAARRRGGPATIPTATRRGVRCRGRASAAPAPTIVASCGSAMRPGGERRDERVGRELARPDERRDRDGDDREEADDRVDEGRRARAPARSTAPRPIRHGSSALRRLGVARRGRRSASAASASPRQTSGHDDDRAAGVREPRERLAQREREERPRLRSARPRCAARSRAGARRRRRGSSAGRMNPAIARPPGRSVIVASEPSRPS